MDTTELPVFLNKRHRIAQPFGRAFVVLPVVLSMLFLALLSLTLSGCVTQEVSVQESANTKKSLLAEPITDQRLSSDDFGFPSQPPSLSRGKTVFQQNCATCHATSFWQQHHVQDKLAYVTPIDLYLLLTKGKAPKVFQPSDVRLTQQLPAEHPAFRDTLNRDDRWAAIFYVRHLAGAGDIQYASLEGKSLDVASIFGGNCAVCHGKRGFADGPLQTGHPSSHELDAAKVHGLFQPPPANFHEYKRFYNRTDAQLFKYIAEGIYPSGMPAWLGNRDKDYNFMFDDKLLWMLVRHVRTFGYANDLPVDEAVPAGALPTRPPLKPMIPPVPMAHDAPKVEEAS